MLAQICFIREMTEKENSIYNLAKTYNLEAYYYISNGLLPAQTEATIECLKSAVFHSIISGQSKQAFFIPFKPDTIFNCFRQRIYRRTFRFYTVVQRQFDNYRTFTTKSV